ncbi:class II fructose-bisphosphate aldolase [Streptomyces sp. NPDC059398]|uniref:class II fructose-bisphosphate aldolase n=1 Tax=Streptomyces sp. NPDC059398 TaxID=3346820 RepID=UPI00367B9B54
MPLVPTAALVEEAVRTASAVLAFNVITLEHAEAVARACERTSAPAVLAVSHNAVRYHHGDPAPLLAACAAVARRCGTPLALHLDHVEDAELALRANELECGSVMFDASRLPHTENVARTADVAGRLHTDGIWVEAELGEIGGKDGVHSATARTDPAEAAEYVTATGIDALAVAVGSSHAMTTRTASLDQELIGRLRDAVGVPLVLHGSSGVPDSALTAAVSGGMRKINFGTHLNTAFTEAVRADLGSRDGVDPRRYLGAGREAVTDAVSALLRLLAPVPDPASAPAPDAV